MQAAAEVRVLQPDQSLVETRFDTEQGVYWGFMNARPRACFSPQLLVELRTFVDSLVNHPDISAERAQRTRTLRGHRVEDARRVQPRR